jgi:hypothetical protein
MFKSKQRIALLVALVAVALVAIGIISRFAGNSAAPNPSGTEATTRPVVRAKPSEQPAESAGPREAAVPAAKPAPKGPYALSPGPLSLGATVLDVMARSDGAMALALARTLTECLLLDNTQLQLEVDRAHATGGGDLRKRLFKEKSDQLTRSRAECQTVTGDVRKLQVQLAQLAYAAKVPGAAIFLGETLSGNDLLAAAERVASDARGGELHSLRVAILGQKIPVSDAERQEMALALRDAFERSPSPDNPVTGLFGSVAEHFWSGAVATTPGGAPKPRSDVFQRTSTLSLPPDLTPPTDPAAQARIARLTEQLSRQVEQIEEERKAARRRAGGS